MNRYTWEAIQDDGGVLTRWQADGVENIPDPWRTRQFHLMPTRPGLQPLSVFVPKGTQFRYVKRRHTDFGSGGQPISVGGDVIYLFGWIHPDQPELACYTFVLPDGRIEQSSDWNHVTRFERNTDVTPLTKYERLTEELPIAPAERFAFPAVQERWLELFVDAEIQEPDETLMDAVEALAFGRTPAVLPG